MKNNTTMTPEERRLPEMRIVEVRKRNGDTRIYVQEKVGFLFIRWWAYHANNGRYNADYDFKTMQDAESYVQSYWRRPLRKKKSKIFFYPTPQGK